MNLTWGLQWHEWSKLWCGQSISLPLWLSFLFLAGWDAQDMRQENLPIIGRWYSLMTSHCQCFWLIKINFSFTNWKYKSHKSDTFSTYQSACVLLCSQGCWSDMTETGCQRGTLDGCHFGLPPLQWGTAESHMILVNLDPWPSTQADGVHIDISIWTKPLLLLSFKMA